MKNLSDEKLDFLCFLVIVVIAALVMCLLLTTPDEPVSTPTEPEVTREIEATSSPVSSAPCEFESVETDCVSEDSNETSEEVVRETMGLDSSASTESTSELSYDYVKDKYKDEIVMLARLVYGEAGIVRSRTHQACVVWTVLNRVDDPRFPSTIKEVVLQPNQFAGYSDTKLTVDCFGRDLTTLVYDVLVRWEREKNGEVDCGRVLPSNYLYFYGDGKENHFRDLYKGDYTIWDYSFPTPYDN